MVRATSTAAMAAALLGAATIGLAADVEIVPPVERIKTDHPRVLLRPTGSAHAIGLDQLKALKRDAEFAQGLVTLRADRSAAAQAMVWLLTGDESAADKSIARLRAYNQKPEDAFDVWFGLRELALAYDWLYGHPKFTAELKAQVRDKAFVLVDQWGLKQGDDHVFHNYTWMNNGGLALWALACYGDDPRCGPLMQVVRTRFNERLFPAMQHLNGQAGDAMGYWYIYCMGSAVWTVVVIQSAFEIDAVGTIRDRQQDWLARQIEGMIQGTRPNLRFIPWARRCGG
jgi:hypothetical protein